MFKPFFGAGKILGGRVSLFDTDDDSRVLFVTVTDQPMQHSVNQYPTT